MCDIVIKKLTFAISSPDDFLIVSHYHCGLFVSSAVSHLVSTSGVCVVESRRRAFQLMSIHFCARCAAAMDYM